MNKRKFTDHSHFCHKGIFLAIKPIRCPKAFLPPHPAQEIGVRKLSLLKHQNPISVMFPKKHCYCFRGSLNHPFKERVHSSIMMFVLLQCKTNIKFLTEHEYIRKRKYYRIRISNIFISRQLPEYEYRIYSCMAT